MFVNMRVMATGKIVRITVGAILIFLMVEPAMGQRWKLRRYEVGFGLGTTQVFGDIGGTISEKNWFGLRDIQIDETRMAIPLNVRYRLTPIYTLKVNGIVGFGSGNDEGTRNDRSLSGRGRSYKTMVNELSAQFEYSFIAEERRYKSAAMFNRRGMLNNYMSFSAYGFAGIGGVYAWARAIVPDPAPYDLVKVHNFGVVLPVGLGVRYIIDDRWLANLELGYRYSFSDYIEGYKQAQDSRFNDVYYFLNLSVGYKLETTRRGLPGFLDREYRAARNRRKSTTNKPRNRRQALN